LDLSKVDVVIEKGQAKETEMYSAFRDPFAWQQSKMEEKLRESGVSDVFVVGLAGDYCVKATAEDAAELGWRGRVWVLEEGVRCVEQSGWEDVKKDLSSVGVNVVGADGQEVGRVKDLGEKVIGS
jgi:nicotinamidase-related amidase